VRETRKQRETKILQEYPAIFIYGIGWPLADGLPHELRVRAGTSTCST
jgi:aspartate--ammonia ligase